MSSTQHQMHITFTLLFLLSFLFFFFLPSTLCDWPHSCFGGSIKPYVVQEDHLKRLPKNSDFGIYVFHFGVRTYPMIDYIWSNFLAFLKNGTWSI